MTSAAAPAPKSQTGLQIHLLLVLLALGCVIVQVYLAGRGAFGASSYDAHKNLGHVLEPVALVLIIATVAIPRHAEQGRHHPGGRLPGIGRCADDPGRGRRVGRGPAPGERADHHRPAGGDAVQGPPAPHRRLRPGPVLARSPIGLRSSPGTLGLDGHEGFNGRRHLPGRARRRARAGRRRRRHPRRRPARDGGRHRRRRGRDPGGQRARHGDRARGGPQRGPDGPAGAGPRAPGGHRLRRAHHCRAARPRRRDPGRPPAAQRPRRAARARPARRGRGGLRGAAQRDHRLLRAVHQVGQRDRAPRVVDGRQLQRRAGTGGGVRGRGGRPARPVRSRWSPAATATSCASWPRRTGWST